MLDTGLDSGRGFDQPIQRMPADSRTDLIFSFGSAMQRTMPDGSELCDVTASRYVLGTRRQGYLFRPCGSIRYVAVRFRPGGLAAFARLPAAELSEIHLDADCLWNQQRLSRLQDRLAEATPIEQIRLLDQWLLSLLDPQVHLDRILYCMSRIGNASGTIDMARLADEISVSHKHMERLFARYVGVQPRDYARLARFQFALEVTVNSPAPYRLNQMALNAGYYDQAHFIRDFKLFTGTTPAKFFSESNPFVQDLMNVDSVQYTEQMSG